MANDLKGNIFGFSANNFAEGNDYARNAGFALDLLIPEKDRDKTIQSLFNVSLSTAKNLRAGKHWTVRHLKTASRRLGRDFDVLVIVPLDEIHERIDDVQNQIDEGIDLLRSEVKDGFYQIMRVLGALVRSAENPAFIAKDGAASQEANE